MVRATHHPLFTSFASQAMSDAIKSDFSIPRSDHVVQVSGQFERRSVLKLRHQSREAV